MKPILNCFRKTPFSFSFALIAAIIIHGLLLFLIPSFKKTEYRTISPMRIDIQYLPPEKRAAQKNNQSDLSQPTPKNSASNSPGEKTITENKSSEENLSATNGSPLPFFLDNKEVIAETETTEETGLFRVDFQSRFSSLQERGLLPSPGYPEQARLSGWEGNVILDITIDKDGQVKNIQMVKSSGYTLLDKICQNTIRNQWEFPPGERSLITRKEFVFILE